LTGPGLTGDRPGDYLADPVRLIAEQLYLEGDRPFGEVMEPWQQAFFEAVFAVRPTGVPLFRLLYDERRRGESKTEDCAAAGLADLLCGPDRHRSYVVAGDQEQAGLVLDSVAGFKARSPVLAGLEVQRNVVRNPATGSELRVLSSDAPTAYGVRPRRVFFDELSLQPDERLWTSMWSAIGKSPQSQMVAVSMAGWDFASLGWRVREQAAKNPAYWFATREGSELAPWLTAEDMAEQEATLHPADYARFWLCKWVEPKGSWITREMYEACEVGEEARAAPAGRRAAGFVDLGLVHDATAIAVCHRQREDAGRDLVVLDTLRTLRGTRGSPVELEAVEDLVAQLTVRLGVTRWTFESWQAASSVQRLRKRLQGVTVEESHPTAESQSQLFANLYSLFSDRRLVLFPHEQLRREALNLTITTSGGRLRVIGSSVVHQDHILSVGGAAQLVAGSPSMSLEAAGRARDLLHELRTGAGRRPGVSYSGVGLAEGRGFSDRDVNGW
jgi:hypothetical protein